MCNCRGLSITMRVRPLGFSGDFPCGIEFAYEV